MEPSTKPAIPITGSREREFADFFAATYGDLLRFVQRRVHATEAEDVAADVFLVAWRRFDEMPESSGESRAWLYGVARRTLLNSARGRGRQRALSVRLAAFTPARSEADVNADLMAARLDISRVWSELTAADQEAICLSVLDGLDGPSAAGVLGISPVAFRLRLSRARRRLRALSDGFPSPSSLERTES